jgi:uncharacterized protein YjiS (DUF1127 family)
MPDQDHIDISTFDYRALTLDQINDLKTAAFRRAHEEREEYLRSLGRGLGRALRGLWAASGHVWHAYRARCRRQAEIAELHGMNDRALKDIGLTRVDIEALACYPRVRATRAPAN